MTFVGSVSSSFRRFDSSSLNNETPAPAAATNAVEGLAAEINLLNNVHRLEVFEKDRA
jgi:hypothetical protein